MDRGPLHSGHSSSDNPPSTSQRLPILAGYFPAWSIYERNYNVADIDAEHLSHILYAFANIHENGTIILGDPWADTEKHFEKDQTVNHKADKWMANVNNLYGNFKQLYFLKRRHPNLKVSLSVGGWSWSTLFPTVAMDVEKRKRFAMSAAQHINDLGLDGIDIDWEFPKTEQEGQAFVTLLKDVRSALNDTQSSANNTPYLLSVAVGCGPDNYKYLHLREMDDYVDLFYLMAYDLAGAWNEKTGHQAALYRDKKINNVQQLTVHDAITHFAKMIPRHKLVMGLPMYGRSFSKTTGPYAEFDGVPDGTWEKGSYDYKDLPRPGALEIYDPEIGASWSYDAKLQEYVTYDNHQVVQQKAQYVMDQGLGGCFFWELTGGGSNDSQRNLLTAAFYSLGSKLDTTPNHLSYPASHYDNIRSFAT
ncbi:chitinase [Halteromyces radiatus]|uniref:chitinase n=1 Tax=Halteromyces radiatus TaxID=101107 RepID=UPI0022211764|nr:chitinase [Halteromyces radiatus]KAI8092922.1 chitinase [Halteromyces radiatus]